jgi:DNA polymerase III subunit chi
MAEVWFYHLDRQPVEAVLPRILAGLMQRGDKVCVQFADATRVEEFSRVLWGYEDAAFIAHGIDGEDVTPHHTLCLTAQAGNPIAASIAAFVDGTMPDELDGLARAMVFLSASDDNALGAARTLWKHYKSQDIVVRYWRQNESGRWEDQAAKAA